MVLLPIVTGLLVYFLHQKHYRGLAVIAQTILLSLAVYLFIRIDVIHQAPMTHSLGQFHSKISINLYADTISALLVVLTAFLFQMCLMYSFRQYFMDRLFIFLFMVLEGLIIGIFLVQDLFSLYALMEVSTIVVSILILYKKDNASIYDGIVYLFTNLVAMTFYLVGIGFIYKIFGTQDLLLLRELVHNVKDPRMLILPYVFIMTAIGLKSALLPLFSWLPHAHGAHSAPYVVSAILSGLYVKGSLYIFIRVQSVFGDVMGTHELFVLLGFITAIIGMFLALSQNDIKLMLAYSTISQIGLIIFSLSLGTDYSYYGAIYHIFNHALFKSALFLTAGILIDSYGTRDMTAIRGVLKRMPFTAIVIIVAGFGITGAPLFNGSISKYLIQRGMNSDMILEYLMILINAGTILYFLKFVAMLFGDGAPVNKATINQKAAIGILASLCLLGGLFGHNLVNAFFNVQIHWDLTDYVQKVMIYLASFIAALLFYWFVYRKRHVFITMREIELSFNELILSIVVFFMGMLVHMMIWV